MARRGNRNVKVLRNWAHTNLGVVVHLTRKTTISGKVIYAVVIDHEIGRGQYKHFAINTYDRIVDAWTAYKIAAFNPMPYPAVL